MASEPDDLHSEGLSRKTVEQELAGSLDRLGVDTVDLYQIHRWDYETDIEQTVRALDDAVRRGQVRSLGASSMWAHQFAAARHAAERLGCDSFRTMQNHYSAVYREEEREMLPLCDRDGLGVIPWAPMAHGFLTRPHEAFGTTARSESGWSARTRAETFRTGGGETINERVQELAAEKGVTMAQIALSWVLHQDVVDAPIVGTSSVEHLEQAVEALDVDLSNSDLAYVDELYEPIPVVGHD